MTFLSNQNKTKSFRFVNKRFFIEWTTLWCGHGCEVEIKCERRGRRSRKALFDAQKNFVKSQGKGILSNLTLK